METPQKPIKPLDHELSTAPHDHHNAQELPMDQSDERPTPINFDQQDDLKLQQIESQIEAIGVQLQEIVHGMESIKKQDREFGHFSNEYLELEMSRYNLRKRLIDLDFSHKEINYPRLYAKKKKQELYYQELQRQKEQTKEKQSQQASNKLEAQNQYQTVKKATQLEDDVISQRPEEECEQNSSQEVKKFDNSTVKFNLQGSQNPYSASIHNFDLNKIDQVESSELEVTKPKQKNNFDNYSIIKQRPRYDYLEEMSGRDRFQRQMKYIDERMEARKIQFYKDTYVQAYKETYQRQLRRAHLVNYLAPIRILRDPYLDDYLFYERLDRLSLAYRYPYL